MTTAASRSSLGSRSTVRSRGTIQPRSEVGGADRRRRKGRLDPIALEIFRGLFVSVCEEMGLALMRSASSTNIKERRDYSCAIFDARGRTIAQGDHMPVHLGSMPASVASVLQTLRLGPGDVAIVNDPYRGGTHLPDITLVAPVHASRSARIESRRPSFYLACRAHHADVGGMQAGSMPLATEIFQEGLIVPPVRLAVAGRSNPDVLDLLLANVRTPRERRADLDAQRAAIETGARALDRLFADQGASAVVAAGAAIQDYSARMMRVTLEALPNGVYAFEDALDDDGFGSGRVRMMARVTIRSGRADVDLTDCADQVRGGVNAVRAITESAVLYVFRTLIGEDVPFNHGLSRPLVVRTRPGSILDARPPAAVAGGNVETSQRIVDLLLGALAPALPALIPAASQGTMNNLALGAHAGPRRVTYYETIAGGMGARPDSDGLSGVHTHMTNSLNTPIEALEQAFPLRVRRYTLRRGSGGAGRFRGGDGIVRAIEALVATEASILSDRRRLPPYGLAGGAPGRRGRNLLQRSGERAARVLPSKSTLHMNAGDVLTIETPGGGGHGRPSGRTR